MADFVPELPICESYGFEKTDRLPDSRIRLKQAPHRTPGGASEILTEAPFAFVFPGRKDESTLKFPNPDREPFSPLSAA